MIVAQRFPYPLDKGDRLTIFHLVKFLSQRHSITLVTFTDDDPVHDPAWNQHLNPYCDRIETLPMKKWRKYLNCVTGAFDKVPLQVHYSHDPAMAKLVDHLVDVVKPDLLYAHYIRMGRYTVKHHDIPRVLAMQLSMTLNYRRLAEHAPTWFHKLLYSVEYKKLKKYEAEFARLFEQVMLISKHDLKAINPIPPLNNVFFNPHGVDAGYFSPDESVEKIPNSILFSGNMQYMPNIDGAIYFYNQIFPLVLEKIPDAQLFIVGTNPTEEILALGKHANVTVTGRVPDLRHYIRQSQITIAPMRVVAGLLNKLLESLAVGVPMVLTSEANEGINASEGDHVLLGDTPDAFAAHVISLLNDHERCQTMGKASREFVTEYWSWEYHLEQLEATFEEIVSDHFVSAR